ncbi:MAG: GNAT family N-acetyltransferase, partial [Bdellovibrio bacteriovorus]
MRIRVARPDDRAAVRAVETAAFPTPSEADLVDRLLGDPTASPVVSLLAEADGKAIGHILLTGATVVGEGSVVPASILAPLAVVPGFQGRGVGQALIHSGIEALAAHEVALVFVLGHIAYYPRAGFRPALPFGLSPPYAIAPEVADAWLVREIRPHTL